MKTLYMTKGLPASGKSTWAKEKVAHTPGTTKRVNKDDLRTMLDNGKWSRFNEDFVLSTRDNIIDGALGLGLHVIVDDTNLCPKHEKRLRDIAKDCGAAFEVVDFTHVSVEECIKRDQKRPNYVGEKVIRDMYNKYLAPKPAEPPAYDPALPSCVIVDIDGTVAKMNGRGPFEWDKVGADLINEPVCDLVDGLMDGETSIVYVSGRDESCRELTEQWLKDKYLCYGNTGPVLFMRPAGDYRDDRIIKQEIYEREIKGKYNVRFVLDDRNKVVDMWRSLGLPCFQVAPGDF